MSPKTWEEEEEEEELAQNARKTRSARRVESKRSERVKTDVTYCEADSEDEFAKEHFMLPSSDEERVVTRQKNKQSDEGSTKSKKKSQEMSPSSSSSKKRSKPVETEEKDEDEQEDEDNNDDDDDANDGESIEYRIQYILGRKSMSPAEWRSMNESYTTIEVTKGSVWKQPDDEYYDPSPEPLEKFLIKWSHASFLHVSWETEKDLLDNVGPTAKNQIKKFRVRELEGRELFEDLSKTEFFPPSFCQIERILDADDPEVDMFAVDWKNAELPAGSIKRTASQIAIQEEQAKSETQVTDTQENVDNEESEKLNNTDKKQKDEQKEKEEEDEEEVRFSSSRRTRKKRIVLQEDDDEEDNDDESRHPVPKTFAHKTRSKKQRLCQYLHGGNCWLTIKWEGLSYSDVTFESLNDLIARGVDFEMALRAFYRREQRALSEPRTNKGSSRRLQLDETIVGSKATPPAFSGGTLRDYQWEGVRWMLFNISQGRNCILADEMGLGKTIQSSALMFMLKYLQPSSGPFLVVAPLSTIVNWQREVSSWTDLDCILYYGSQEDRDLIRSYEFKFLNSPNKKSNSSSKASSSSPGYKIEVVITTPETCMAFDDKVGTNKFKRELSRIAWDLVIVDEAHKLKNFDSKFSSTLRDDYTFKNCVLLTGTPLQNSTEELWTLLNFVASEDFGDREEFIEKFGELKTSTQLDALHKRIKPYLLRREKDIVEKGVPPKKEVVIEVELTVPQKQYYRAIYEQKTGFLYKSGTKDGPSLSNLAMELRKCCNHPFLIKGAGNELSKHFVNDSIHDILVKSSGKMTLLDKLLPKLQRDGHRVLIFSQFRMMLDLIEDYLCHCGYLYERVDGSVVGKKRQAAIDRYSQNGSIFAMLLSTRAGGVGINLTAADTVIIFDSDWNPQNDIQAQARAHRIGQTRSVTVYRLLTKKTYEMVMFRAASIKLGLDYAVMHNLGHDSISSSSSSTLTTTTTRRSTRSRNASAELQQLEGISSDRAEHASSLSKKELETLLKHGAYDMFVEDKDGLAERESTRFVEESIEQILERSSVFIHQENRNNNSDNGSDNSNTHSNESSAQTHTQTTSTKGGSFAKASFVSAESAAGEGNEIAIDDPDFWSKVIGIAVEEEQSGLGGKRKCRQVVESYREPSESIRSIYGSLQNALRDDNDNEDEEDSDEDEEKKSKRRRKDEIVPAEFSVDNLLALLSALCNVGYGSWGVVQRMSKLRWSLADIRRGCQLALLFVLLASSFAVEENNAKSGGNNKSDCEEPEGGKCRASLDAALFLSNVRKYKCSKFVLHCVLESVAFDDEDGLLSVWCERVNSLPFSTEKVNSDAATTTITTTPPLSLAQYKASFDKQFFDTHFHEETDRESVAGEEEEKKENKSESANGKCEKIIEKLLAISEINAIFRSLTENDSSASTTASSNTGGNAEKEHQKRTLGFRSKLAQVEDLFECSLFCRLSDALSVDPSPAATQGESSEKDPVPQREPQDEIDDATKNSKEDSPQEQPQVEPLAADGDEAVSVAAEKPKPIVCLPARLAPLLVVDEIAKKPPMWWATNYDVALLHAARQNGWPEGKRRVAGLLDTLWQLSPADESSTAMSELLTQKFALQRFKQLCKTLRHAEEDVAAAEKQRAAEQASLRQQAKKNTTQLLKLVQRNGYPRSVYTAVRANVLATVSDEEERNKRLAALYSWETLAQECNMEDNVSQTQEIVYSALVVFNASDANDAESITTDAFEDIPMKLIKAAFEKSDIVHHIRLTLACHSVEEIKDCIVENCKGTGPNVQAYRRDMTMPVWWTMDHDVALLRLCLSQGFGSWKAICADPAVNAVSEDFVLPPKVNGAEWVMQLTPRSADKRVLALLRGMPAVKSLPLPPPSSPQKKGSAAQKSAAPPAVAKNFWFQQQKESKDAKEKDNSKDIKSENDSKAGKDPKDSKDSNPNGSKETEVHVESKTSALTPAAVVVESPSVSASQREQEAVPAVAQQDTSLCAVDPVAEDVTAKAKDEPTETVDLTLSEPQDVPEPLSQSVLVTPSKPCSSASADPRVDATCVDLTVASASKETDSVVVDIASPCAVKPVAAVSQSPATPAPSQTASRSTPSLSRTSSVEKKTKKPADKNKTPAPPTGTKSILSFFQKK